MMRATAGAALLSPMRLLDMGHSHPPPPTTYPGVYPSAAVGAGAYSATVIPGTIPQPTSIPLASGAMHLTARSTRAYPASRHAPAAAVVATARGAQPVHGSALETKPGMGITAETFHRRAAAAHGSTPISARTDLDKQPATPRSGAGSRTPTPRSTRDKQDPTPLTPTDRLSRTPRSGLDSRPASQRTVAGGSTPRARRGLDSTAKGGTGPQPRSPAVARVAGATATPSHVLRPSQIPRRV